MSHPILIPWNILTTGFDSYAHQFNNNDTMTYLDLLTELENLPEEELLKPVQVYDEDVNDFSNVRRITNKNGNTNLII
tara:strand:- start:122 stop:355 length:234 start_codon:yes stop_codon:yes gene_type:complete